MYNNLKEINKNTYLSYELLALPKGPPFHLLPSKHDETQLENVCEIPQSSINMKQYFHATSQLLATNKLHSWNRFPQSAYLKMTQKIPLLAKSQPHWCLIPIWQRIPFSLNKTLASHLVLVASSYPTHIEV